MVATAGFFHLAGPEWLLERQDVFTLTSDSTLWLRPVRFVLFLFDIVIIINTYFIL